MLICAGHIQIYVEWKQGVIHKGSHTYVYAPIYNRRVQTTAVIVAEVRLFLNFIKQRCGFYCVEVIIHSIQDIFYYNNVNVYVNHWWRKLLQNLNHFYMSSRIFLSVKLVARRKYYFLVYRT